MTSKGRTARAKTARRPGADPDLRKSASAKDRSGRRKQQYRIETLDGIIRDKKRLRAAAGISGKRFDHKLAALERAITRDGQAPKFRDRSYEMSGNRCGLYVRHALLLYLMYEAGGASQTKLAEDVGINQSSISRYVGLVRRHMRTGR